MGNFSRILKSAFASQKKVWQQLADELNAEYVNKGLFKAHTITKKLEQGEIILDSFSRNRGNQHETYTRFQTECANPGKIQFLIKRKNIFNKKAPKGSELFLTEMEVFDRKYRLFGSNKRDIKRLLDRKMLANIVEQKPFSNIRIELKEQNLELKIKSLNKDLVQLKSLFNLVEDLRYKIGIEF